MGRFPMGLGNVVACFNIANVSKGYIVGHVLLGLVLWDGDVTEIILVVSHDWNNAMRLERTAGDEQAESNSTVC